MSIYIHPAAFTNSILYPSDMVKLTFGLCPFCGNPVHPLAPPSRHTQRCVPCDKVFFLDENLSGSEPIASVREPVDPHLSLSLSGKTSFLPPFSPPVEEAPPTRLAEGGGQERGAGPEGATQPEHEREQGRASSLGPWADSARTPSPPRRGHLHAQEIEYGSLRRSIQETLAFSAERPHDDPWPYAPSVPPRALPRALPPSSSPFLLGFALGLSLSALVFFLLPLLSE